MEKMTNKLKEVAGYLVAGRWHCAVLLYKENKNKRQCHRSCDKIPPTASFSHFLLCFFISLISHLHI
ncbi:hypothetical protein GOBAR_AA17616 [Gossypium barbadense]|uniref:Uncharacterized protein n=1 Tax=Gossypium barbadense TaxID=3634 RepID=A0A2P5XI96_GOSBA|nr:hypothetical protein GOBAR_AA17616 [Gossypium barbadense]